MLIMSGTKLPEATVQAVFAADVLPPAQMQLGLVPAALVQLSASLYDHEECVVGRAKPGADRLPTRGARVHCGVEQLLALKSRALALSPDS